MCVIAQKMVYYARQRAELGQFGWRIPSVSKAILRSIARQYDTTCPNKR
jgi:hypothetical protein